MKYLVPVLVLILVLTFLCSCSGTQNPPAIEYGEFPFRVVYKSDGETHIIEDVIICEFNGYDLSALFQKPRSWNIGLKSDTDAPYPVSYNIRILEFDDNTNSVLNPDRVIEEHWVSLSLGAPAHYMGDPNASSMVHKEPHFYYIELYESAVSYFDSTMLTHAQVKELFGIEVVEWTFSEPIVNSFR